MKMIRYVLSEKEVTFNSLEEAKKAYQGMTLDVELNGGSLFISNHFTYGFEEGIEPYDTEELKERWDADAKRYAELELEHSTNYYYFHNVFGYAKEIWLELEETDENGKYMPVSGYHILCKNSNWDAFQQQLKEEALKNK